MLRRCSIAVAVAVALMTTTAAQSPAPGAPSPELSDLLTRVGVAVERYYSRAQTVVWMEEITFQTLGFDLVPDRGMYRRLNYDLRVTSEIPEGGGAPEAVIQRELLRVNGRAARPSDKPRCGDPAPVLPDTLDFLRPGKQSDTIFKLGNRGRSSGRPALTLEYRSRLSGPGTITEHDDDEDCVSLQMPGSLRGRVWIDPASADVLQIEEHLAGPVDMRWAPGSKGALRTNDVVIERLDSTVVFREVTFTEPDERIMLPSSVDSMRVIRNLGDTRLRTTQRFSNYRRFTTEGRIVEE
jgi:hypothetical protein